MARMVFCCPRCGRTYERAVEHEGRKARCSGCETVFHIPGPPVAILLRPRPEGTSRSSGPPGTLPQPPDGPLDADPSETAPPLAALFDEHGDEMPPE